MRQPYRLLLPGVAAIIIAAVAHAQPAVPPPAGCDQAQILDVSGKWVANPGGRGIARWDCIKGGDELLLADAAASGSITVIYRKGAKPPYTRTCPSPACRNAYRVESVSAAAAASSWDGLLDFVFTFFKPRKPTPVPGILHGALTPPSPVLCSVNGKVSPAMHAGVHEASLKALDRDAPTMHWSSGQGIWNVDQGDLHQPFVYELKIPASKLTSQVHGWVLVAPESACGSLEQSMELAVSFRQTWPKETPEQAATNFYLMYLDALARASARAPRLR